MARSRGAVKKAKAHVVTQKQKRNPLKPISKILPKAVSVWKGKDTVRSNYEKMGLAAELNSDASIATCLSTREGLIRGKKSSSLSLSSGQIQEMRARVENAAPSRLFMFEGDQEFVEALQKKYGNDYERMAKDRKLNRFQHTPGQIRRKVEKYLKVKEAGLVEKRGIATKLPCHTWNAGTGKKKEF
ncbi:hypothetical protein GUITHDRAFT_140689 [Guillardia theta CCMP2712]|uniref:Nucleolar protein 16 n=1 Tax=Guillardia theta (strain CCMP2712) TaxID=905079 RepID=L1J442_GUITC|nr:hypothetical protein GUITHDRAFT_140689 [Guillardia theta CCMP2712]EKX43107.1 hypothetical protein GUITHDRAFT_140689 [Guillardia theta CCMP2712]|eukprot:XP_005830087.1 hypothetical protein GUITHDRAFT_140689 [Guillardia theta CCMP2712]